MQPSDQGVGRFTPSEMEVDEGDVRSAFGEQVLGLTHSRGWAGDVRSQKLKKVPDRFSDIPGILDHEDFQARQIIR